MAANKTESTSKPDMARQLASFLRNNTTWKVALAVAVILTVVLFEYADRKELGRSVSGFICLGSRFMPPDETPEGLHQIPGVGYDGQFFYFIAQDPLIRGDMHRRLDVPAYRYQRIGYPMLVAIMSLGIDSLVPTMLVVVNLLAIIIGTVFVAFIFRDQNMSEWYALFYGLLSGLLIAMVRDLSAPVAMCFGVIAMFYYSRKRFVPCAIFLALAILSREMMAALVPVLVLDSLLNRKGKSAALLQVASLLPFAGWKLYVNATLKTGVGNSIRNSMGRPFSGMYNHVRYMLGAPNEVRSISEKLYLFVFVAVVIVSLLYAIREVIRSRNEISLALLGFSIMPFVMSHHVWVEPWSYGRVLVPGAVFLVLSFARSKDKWYLLPLCGHVLLFLVMMEYLSIW